MPRLVAGGDIGHGWGVKVTVELEAVVGAG